MSISREGLCFQKVPSIVTNQKKAELWEGKGSDGKGVDLMTRETKKRYL